jgi:acetyltransferase-like isoleucine patch superfamily enzyme
MCGENVALFEGVYFHAPSKATIGDNVSIHPMCYIDATGGLSVGSDVSIAHSTTIMTTEHTFSATDANTRDSPVRTAPVTIGDDVWIGAAVRILAGVTIGEHVVIGAGAVVTENVPPNTLAVGVPARPIKTIKSAA